MAAVNFSITARCDQTSPADFVDESAFIRVVGNVLNFDKIRRLCLPEDVSSQRNFFISDLASCRSESRSSSERSVS